MVKVGKVVKMKVQNHPVEIGTMYQNPKSLYLILGGWRWSCKSSVHGKTNLRL